MKRTVVFILALLLLGLAGCGAGQGERSIEVWRAVAPYYGAGGELARPEYCEAVPGVGTINSAISCFNSASADKELVSPLPSDMKILGYQLWGTQLRLQLPAGFASLDREDVTLARCCMALTFCSIDGVRSVSVWSEGKELYPPLSEKDVVLFDDPA